jgi:hypothetical protein
LGEFWRGDGLAVNKYVGATCLRAAGSSPAPPAVWVFWSLIWLLKQSADARSKSTEAQSTSNTYKRSQRVLEHLHSDLCRPMRTLAPQHGRYILGITDDYFRLTVAKIIHTKDQVEIELPRIIAILEAQSGQKVARLRMDNGGEYRGEQLHKDTGIVLESTDPYHSETNCMAERVLLSINHYGTDSSASFQITPITMGRSHYQCRLH